MNPKELRIEFYKSGGPGGQHKNKRNMAVRITHQPTGLVAVAQEFRSQALNKQIALARLEKKLQAKYKRKTPRIPTKPSFSSKEKVLDWKKKRGFKKKLRQERIGLEE